LFARFELEFFPTRTLERAVNHWLNDTLEHLKLGEALIAGGVEGLVHGLQAKAGAIGRLCTGAERWQAAIRQIQAPLNLADIIRARTF
jgi:hypothetical protein